jgi:hypothetical protein
MKGALPWRDAGPRVGGGAFSEAELAVGGLASALARVPFFFI